ncbi:hypothetical protein V6N11_060813 [Hibiscus sabdariffa]|uniref:Kinesin-like protein n=1 Tax=Hibiscus sabdariffa TaxID=183260 RepID=A0ABR2QRQ6_9ROSI
MLVYQDLITGDELLSDSFPYREIENGMLWEVDGKWVVQGAVNVDIGANPSAEGADEDEGVDDQAVKVVDIVDTFRLQEQPAFDKKQFIAYIKKFIKNLTPKLDAEKQENFKKNIEGATKYLLGKLKDLQFFVGESMLDDGCVVFAYYKEGATDPTFLYLAYALKEELAPQRRSQRDVCGQMHQSNAAATALYDHSGGESLHNADSAASGDAGEAVMARWLQSAGLRHLASPTGIEQRLLSDLLMQGYGAQSAEEKQRLVALMRNVNFNGGSRSEPCIPTRQRSGVQAMYDGFYSSEFRGDIGFGLLDLHAMDDTELLSENVISEPFKPSPFMPNVNKVIQNESSTSQQQKREHSDADALCSADEKETSCTSMRENSVAKIKVVVRKRPLNKKEISRKEDDIVTVKEKALTVHEPKLKVDLTAYVEKHEFCFDAVLDEHVTNDEVYRETVEPIIPIIFQRTKATCFAYGQTGSGKTFTMQPLPLRAAQDLVRYLNHPLYRHQNFKLWLGFYEIYGGKLYDLLSERKRLFMREDGKQQVCIVGLQEFEVSDVQMVKEYIERGNAARSTGSTGANEESSRSHAILQLVIKKHSKVKESKRNNDGNESKVGKVVGKISFIDLAGSERGADTTDNDRQTRIEGAEINKSLLALKECIRALDNDKIHIPFRGSKLTEVLRDSFVGRSRTVMISCISPNAGSCEHTLNTLRYADRVKSLSRSSNSKKDQSVNSSPSSYKDAYSFSATSDVEDFYEQPQEVKVSDTGRRLVEKDVCTVDFDKQPFTFPSSQPLNKREESGTGSVPTDKERLEASNSYGGSVIQRTYSSNSQTSVDAEEKVQKVSPPRGKATREENSEMMQNRFKNDGGGPDLYATNSRQVNAVNYNGINNVRNRRYDPETPTFDTEEKVQKVSRSPPRGKATREENSEMMRNWFKNDGGGSDLSATNSRQAYAVNYNDTNNVRIRRYDSEPPTLGSEERVQKVSPPRGKATREENSEMMRNWFKNDGGGPDLSATNSRQVNAVNYNGTNNVRIRRHDPEPPTVDTEERVQKVSPPRGKATREENSDTMQNWSKNDGGGSDLSATNSRQANADNYNGTNNVRMRRYDPKPPTDGSINSVLAEEEALTAAHRKEIEDTMEIVREEMKLLAEVDQAGCQVDSYVTRLSFLLSRKAASLVSLQARLARFQHRLKEEEILNAKRVPR